MSTSSSNSATTRQRQRVAFIVGNDEYVHLEKLPQSVKDAELISTTLQNIGFITYLYRNLTTRELKEEWFRYFDFVQDNSLVFFYFNGHGIEHSINNLKDNYLFGIDAPADLQEDSMMSNEQEKISGLPLRKFMWEVVDRSFVKKFVVIFVLDAGRLNLQYATRCSPRRYSGTFNSIMTQEVGLPNPDRLLQLDLSPEDTNIVEFQVDFVYTCQPGFYTMEDIGSENGCLARALHHSLSKAGSWHDAILEAKAQVCKESYILQRPSAEINIMYKLEIKDLAATSQSPNIDITTQIPSTSSVQQQQSVQYYSPRKQQSHKWTQYNKPVQFGLEIPDILRKKIQNGILENENFELVDEEDDILINLKNSPDEVTIEKLTLKQILSQDCEFSGIGLRIETSSELNPSGDVVVNNFKLDSEFGFDFVNIESASMEKIFVKNCVKSGFRLKNIQLVTMKDIHVSDCSVGIDGNDVKAVNCDDLLVERCVFGFGIQKCDGQLTNCEFKECDVEIYKVSGNFQSNP